MANQPAPKKKAAAGPPAGKNMRHPFQDKNSDGQCDVCGMTRQAHDAAQKKMGNQPPATKSWAELHAELSQKYGS